MRKIDEIREINHRLRTLKHLQNELDCSTALCRWSIHLQNEIHRMLAALEAMDSSKAA